MADEQDMEHQEAFVFYCDRRSEEFHRVFGVEEPPGQIILAPADLSLFVWPGGECSVVHLVGVAEDEVKPAFDLDKPQEGIRALYRLLCKHGIGSCSMPERPSLAESPRFLEEWQSELAAVQAENG